MTGGTSLTFLPLLPWPWLGAVLALAALAAGWGLARRARGAGWRLAALAALALALLQPSLAREDRQPVKDTVVVVVDQSPSQSIGRRAARTAEALAGLEKRLAGFPDLDLRVVRTGAAGDSETRLFGVLAEALADVPPDRRAGAILITDGLVHDVPADAAAARAFGPVHALLTGERDEADRRLEIVSAPSYGLVGHPVTVMFRVDDLPRPQSGEALVTVREGGAPPRVLTVPVGRPVPLVITPSHAGRIVVDLTVGAAPRELTLVNNRAGVAFTAVRDRLKVLLVSGEPYPGERVWRAVLKSDPGVDLVHFTILRPPEKQDGTPLSELSLIPFPVRDLFEVKLHGFDLVIFDRYRQRGVLPLHYLDAIADYVRKGGALLEAGGTAFGDPGGLGGSALAAVLPARPAGPAREEAFRPAVTEAGRRHPVTAGLAGAGEWGRWLQQADLEALRGTVVMSGASGRPLLILDRVGEGRVAQLASDQIWLWSRGFEGGGPQAELLRRLAHWLMKEPELEENDLRVRAEGSRLVIERRSLQPSTRPVSLTAPGGDTRTITLRDDPDGVGRGEITVDAPGLWRLADGEREAVALVGDGDGPEFADVRTTADRLAGVAKASGGGIAWLVDGGLPEIRRIAPGTASAGPGWLGLVANGTGVVTGSRETPLLPPLLLLVLALATLALAWRREGR